MGKPVLFVTGLGNDLNRAENIKALYEAYQGGKRMMSAGDPNYENVVGSGVYDLMVIDIFPRIRPKRAMMVWHAIQGGKYIGLDQKGSYYREDMAGLMDCIVAAGRGGVDMFHRCTGVPKEKILNLGMPRTDRYMRWMKPRNGKRNYLYAPTFRGGGDVKMPETDWKAIDELLTDDELMMVKAHPYGPEFRLEGYRHIVEIRKMEPTVAYLMDADVVITDYSSIIFDGWLMEKPAVLFEKEKGYTQQRGMYLEYPGGYSERYATDERELVRLIREAEGLTETERRCRDYVADMCDGHSCERICRVIDEMS